ncbi:glycosyltransferase [Amycolatopsis alkalitolerans]|uniref:Glycosyltransferase n=1 Tax=Amycolatopsis alkalitolerans TaxID=2547244 RepID=A0A5C4LRJ9_9PSEU|nr:glycosyltransferase [Amycolatopsis alkalitolerans]TNC21015.1 glycosyltransferase [Amycolatopsis alkalitolerans]
MSALTPVPIAALPLERFAPVIGDPAYRRLMDRFARGRDLLGGHAMWNVNSTARGGGVAEMLVSLLAYGRGAGIDARWEVIRGDEAFFTVTKRIHNHLHGAAGDGRPLDGEARAVYEAVTRAAGEDLANRIVPGDVVLLHDPQTVGMIPVLKRLGVPVVWRCHVGIDDPDGLTRRAWGFLRDYVRQADAYVFSRRQYVWGDLDPAKTVLIAPSIDAFSAKNQELSQAQVSGILSAAGLQDSDPAVDGDASFARLDTSPGRVERPAEADQGRPLRPDDVMVLQVSRWDGLKDPLGVIDGFVRHVLPNSKAHLVYAGPSVEAIADDPEGRSVLAAAREYYGALSDEARERVHLVTLPMTDLEENAAVVNALQRRAHVVVQKSIAEGFGLTVAEAMWKSRPVVASRIGGIQDQIEDGRSGWLVGPRDLAAYGNAVVRLAGDPRAAAAMGGLARLRVRGGYLGSRSLLQYIALFERLLLGEGAPAEVSAPAGYA